MNFIKFLILGIFFAAQAFFNTALTKELGENSFNSKGWTELKKIYQVFMIYNKNLNSYFCFSDIVLTNGEQVRSFNVIQYKGIGVYQFTSDKLTMADKDNGISYRGNIDIRIPSKRLISVDLFDGKPPIVNFYEWQNSDGGVTPTVVLKRNEWSFSSISSGYIDDPWVKNIYLEKIKNLSDKNVLQNCRNDSCIEKSILEYR